MRIKVDQASNDLLSHYFPEESHLVEMEEIIDDNNNKRWQPKKWKVEYEKIVLMDLMGLKGYEIAEKMGYTPQHVYNILGTDEAIAIQRAMVGKIRESTFNMTDELNEIQKLTVKRLKQCLKDEDKFNTARLGFISKGIDVMKGMGEHLKHSPSNVVNNTFTLPASVADRFLEGLKKSDEARLLLAEKNNESQ